MKRISFIFILLASICFQVGAQIRLEYTTPRQPAYKAGDKIELNIIIKTRPETCTKGMKQVKIYLSGLKRDKLTDWKELSKGLWTAHIALSVTDKPRKAGKLTIMRRVDKEDLFKQELFPLE